MALNATTLSSAIKAALELDENVIDDAKLQKFCDSIANAVVNHITANAVVTTAVSGVTVGSGAAVGTGTIS